MLNVSLSVAIAHYMIQRREETKRKPTLRGLVIELETCVPSCWLSEPGRREGVRGYRKGYGCIAAVTTSIYTMYR